MVKSTMRQAASVYSTVAACAVLAACGGDDSEPEEKPQEVASQQAPTDTTVVFHLTGLVLVIPPRTPGDSVHVVLPADSAHDVAWFGFGMQGADSARYAKQLCQGGRYGDSARAAGICYVNLHDWGLAPFGAGGPRTDPARPLPPGVVNVTRGSGGQHVVHMPSITSEHYDSRISFLAGESGQNPCILATWMYKHRGEAQGQRLRMVNVLDWEIRKPTSRALVFGHRHVQDSTITVPLPPPDGSGRIELLLAHIPSSELEDLPPERPGPPPSAPDTAHHFTAFYNVLRKPGTPPEEVPHDRAHRPLPHTSGDHAERGCVVGITTTNPNKRYMDEPRALGTYACMVGSAQGM